MKRIAATIFCWHTRPFHGRKDWKLKIATMRIYIFYILLIFSLFLTGKAFPGDWPMYKGNIYFTGNNDEIIVKGNQIRWIFRGFSKIVNPIASDGRIYFADLRKNVFCLDELTGRLLWKINLKKISAQFMASRRIIGKIKYPVIKGKRLILSDSSLIYCINKLNGRVIWARTGMRFEKNLGRFSRARVDGIYSNPIISRDALLYGTRRVFIMRSILDGKLLWDHMGIKSYSAFPTFFDKFIFTQSMDYGTGTYTIYCLFRESGKIKWKTTIEKPFQILAPVIYKKQIYVPSGKKMYSLDFESGRVERMTKYAGLITSTPTFTDREILFTINNQDIISTDTRTGRVLNRISTPRPSSLKYITIRDRIYIASSIHKNINGRKISYTRLWATGLHENKKLWQFITPFPGEPSQHMASGGVIFLAAGNHLYAIGKDPVKINGDDTYIAYLKKKKMTGNGKESHDIKKILPKNYYSKKKIAGLITSEKKRPPSLQRKDFRGDGKIPLRKLRITVVDKHNRKLKGRVTVKKRHKGEVVFLKKYYIDNQKKSILIPDDDRVEIIVESNGHLPGKVHVSKQDKEIKVTLTRIEQGEILSLQAIEFEFNRAYLRPNSLDILNKMSAVLKVKPGLRLEIQGHTDSRGDAAYNQLLSEKRAEAVKDYFIKQGISPLRLTTKGFGMRKPIAENETAEGQAKNRRTDFKIISS